MKSVQLFLLNWGISFVALWYGAHELFYPPGDWIGALIVSFGVALGIGALIKARLERRDAAIIARPEGLPQDGKRIAIAGTIELTGEPLRAPLSGQECVVYDYSISHVPKPPPLIGKTKNVPQADTGGVTLIRGTREEALAFMRDKGTGSLIAAALLLLAPGPILYGILTHREHFIEESHKPSVRSERLEAFRSAVNTGSLDAVRSGIRRGMDVSALDEQGNTALGNAGIAATAAALIEAGAKIEARSRDGLTPLMEAAGQGHADVVQLLIAQHANVNAKSRDRNRTALDYATYIGQDEIIQMLLTAGAREGR